MGLGRQDWGNELLKSKEDKMGKTEKINLDPAILADIQALKERGSRFVRFNPKMDDILRMCQGEDTREICKILQTHFPRPKGFNHDTVKRRMARLGLI